MSFGTGQVVDHYRLDRIVAITPSVTVFAAFDLRLFRIVALKELSAELSADQAFRAQFARDAARAAQLDHPGIASVFDSNEHDGSLYFVTKFVDGALLRDVARSRPIPVAEAMVYLEQIAAALDHAHRRGVVHGSVGPGAVLIGTGETAGSAVLFDVGIGKRRPADDEEVSPAWFPPATGDWSPTGPAAEHEALRVDVVGLARMAFELLTRRAPEDALASASRLEPSLPPGVDEVFADVLGDADGDTTCSGFVAALRRAMPASLLVAGSPPPAGTSSIPSATATPSSSARPVGDADDRRRRFVLVAASVIGVLLVAGVLLWQGTRSTEAGRESLPPAPAAPSTSVRTASPASAAPTTVRATSTAATSTSTSTTTTVAPTTVAPDEPETTAPTVSNPFGDVVGQPVVEPASAQGRAAVALQQRRPPVEVALVDTPAAYYAEWLRLTTGMPSGPVVATADGYAIDAGTPAEINQFQATETGEVVSFVECVGGACASVTGGIQLTENCEPGPGCNAFATDDERALAVLRATVALRNPAITLLFSVTSNGSPVVGVSDPYNTVHYDAETGAMSVTLATAPPAGTQMSVTFAYEDGTRSQMAITYG